MAYRERQKLVEATDTAGAVQASEETAAQAAGAASAAASGEGTSESAGAVQHVLIHWPGLETFHQLPFVRQNQSLSRAKVVN
eukprot:6461275-Amphidinium_carterae.2